MDRENIVKRFADYVYYFKAYCTSDADDHEMLKAVLALLNEQEAVEPRLIGKEGDVFSFFVCGDCGEPLYGRMNINYCAHCGRAVRWDA